MVDIYLGFFPHSYPLSYQWAILEMHAYVEITKNKFDL